jgi:dTDP-4-amino-4,6-dideoxygalactose transaminase
MEEVRIVGGPLAAEAPEVYSVYHQYTVRLPRRDAVSAGMRERGIATMIYYPIPLHRQPVNQSLGYAAGSLPESERAAQEVLSLPIWPEITEETQRAVVTSLKASLAASRTLIAASGEHK